MRVPEDRDARIAELQARLRARRASLVRAPVALICLAGALYLLSRQWPDVAYALSATEPAPSRSLIAPTTVTTLPFADESRA